MLHPSPPFCAPYAYLTAVGWLVEGALHLLVHGVVTNQRNTWERQKSTVDAEVFAKASHWKSRPPAKGTTLHEETQRLIEAQKRGLISQVCGES